MEIDKQLTEEVDVVRQQLTRTDACCVADVRAIETKEAGCGYQAAGACN